MRSTTICIPRIDKSITYETIKSVFQSYNFGNIKDINIVSGRENNKVFIKYNYWNTSPQSIKFRNAINNKQEVKLFYQFPCFWKCYKSFSRL